MEATFTYSRAEVEKMVVEMHSGTFHEAPKGYEWRASPDTYGTGKVKVELVEEEMELKGAGSNG